MVRSIFYLGAALLSASVALADDPPSCAANKKCPKETPCCSQYGQCGVGAFCLGGCDPQSSFSLDACAPAPVCKSKTHKMDSLDGIMSIEKYLGDPKKADWVAQGDPLAYAGNVLLTMPPKSVGTVLSSTTYMWYGNVKAKLKTSRGPGVVTAFILFSDVKDEIDYEFIGADLTTAQTNYYFQGILNNENSGNISNIPDTFETFHEYEIRWTPESITWLVDGKVGRTKKKSETFNATSNQFDFPQTPSRVQLSLWPGGADSNAAGTIAWAGGKINWDSSDVKDHGYYWATLGEVSMECFNANDGPGTNKHTSYTYRDAAGTNDTVVDGDKPTVLKSFAGTGLNMNAGGSSGSKSGSSSGAAATVPGGSNGGTGNTPGDDGGSGDGSGTSSSPQCESTGFAQNCGSNGGGSGNKNTGARGVERTLGASAFAVIVAVGCMLWL